MVIKGYIVKERVKVVDTDNQFCKIIVLKCMEE